jgi:hypothetical protein
MQQIMLDSDPAQWQHCFTGRVQRTMKTIYRVGPTSWCLFVVGSSELMQRLVTGQLVDATVEPDGCGVVVTIQCQIEHATSGQPIRLLRDYRMQEALWGSTA